jgi:hypothetical protein
MLALSIDMGGTHIGCGVTLLDDYNRTRIEENQNVRLLSFPISTGSNPDVTWALG